MSQIFNGLFMNLEGEVILRNTILQAQYPVVVKDLLGEIPKFQVIQAKSCVLK